MTMNRFIRKTLLFLVLLCALYGIGRLYYAFTGGFSLSNITYELPYDARWQTHPLSVNEQAEISRALNQEYTYLSKGCQAYVFESADGKYVLKFFKYQRFRPQAWINLFTIFPFVDRYQQAKAIEKKEKLDKVFRSWKIAYENLQKDTGVVFAHLNKTNNINKNLSIRDKLGLRYEINLDQIEFLLQRRAKMLCPTIDSLMSHHQEKQAIQLLDRLFSMLLSEYERGFADNDHALMQNTGVFEGFPIHIDVGQFIYNPVVKDPKVYKQEIYDKTYKLGAWLEKHYPGLALHLKTSLISLIGVEFYYMGPYVHKGDVAKIPHKE